MRIEKIIKTFTITALAIGSVFSLNMKAEAASTISIEKAAQKIYTAETKAYKTKKDVSVTVKISASSNEKKTIKKVTGELENALIKEEFGDVDLTYVVRGKYVRPAIGHVLDHVGDESSHKLSWRTFYYPASLGAYQKVSYSKKVLTITMSVKGSQGYYRDQYKENTYLAKCVKDLREKTNGLSEKDKAWTVGMWLDEHMGYGGEYDDGRETKYSCFWTDGASGVCEQNARAYQLFACLMGCNAGYILDGNGIMFIIV